MLTFNITFVNYHIPPGVTWLKYCRYGVKRYPINQQHPTEPFTDKSPLYPYKQAINSIQTENLEGKGKQVCQVIKICIFKV